MTSLQATNLFRARAELIVDLRKQMDANETQTERFQAQVEMLAEINRRLEEAGQI